MLALPPSVSSVLSVVKNFCSCLLFLVRLPFTFILTFTFAAATAAAKPNILILLADDLGYGDVQSYNPSRGKIPTPHIDRLAAQGVRFTDGHASSAACSPSRYTLLTGRYHWRTKLQSGIVDLWDPPLIAPDRLTVASLAQQHGYKTAAFGKWHLGWDWPITADQRRYMRGLGGRKGKSKDVLLTTPTPAHRDAWKSVFSQRIAGGPTTRGFDHYFGTDVPNWPPYSFIHDDRTVGVPTDLLPASALDGYLASFQGPALPDWKFENILNTLVERTTAYLQERAARREPFLVYVPLTSPHTPISPSEKWRGRSGLNDYADLVMETDDAIGRILTALEETGAAPNTFVFFSSDNGYETAIGIKPLEAKGHFPSGPLRGYKRDVWEGGHREPFIVRYPGVAKAGTVSDALVHHADLMATVADLLGAKLPPTAGEDSFSLLPHLRAPATPVRPHAISTGANGTQSLRDGPWKLVCLPKPQLYNLTDDLAEKTDLAAQHPDRVKSMLALRERLIEEGRSTPGHRQPNDVPVKR